MAIQAFQRQPDLSATQSFNESLYEEFFLRLTGDKPYPYQTRVAKELSQGKSLILRAPTGSGKTWATVAPFVHSRLTRSDLTDRLIYALPLRSLASNLYDSTYAKLKEFADFRSVICCSPKARRYQPGDPFYLGLQMGGQQEDPFFQGDTIFTTIDQLLSAYLFAPVSLPDRVGNIGAGALIGSLLVFDEVHLLDPERSLGTTIEMLVRLKGLAQFVLMTATMPDSVMNWLGSKLEAQTISLSTEEVRKLPSHKSKQRAFEWRSGPLTAEDITKEHTSRTIVIANSVGRAQELFRQVSEVVKGWPKPPLVFLLHSRFFREDRKYWESQLAVYFGPKATLDDAILISTQVVEAGIDISGDVLLTELAPLSALLQRAGRVARYTNRNVGRFLVFDLVKDDQDRHKLGPYRDRETAEIIAATRDLLASATTLTSLEYAEELKWLKRVHEDPDLAALRPLDSLRTRADEVLRAMDGLDEAACPRLLRETASVNVVLTDKPEELRFNSKEWPELLSVPRSSLFRLKDVCSRADSNYWVLKVPEEIQSESSQSLGFAWRTVINPTRISWLVAINPAYARYSRDVGLEIGEPSDSPLEVRYKPSPPAVRYSYQKEPFVTHAKRVVENAERILVYSRHAVAQLSQQFESLVVRDIVLAACALHDTGKLQIQWQHEAEWWQRNVDLKLGRSHELEVLAHTDFDPQRDRGEQWPKFPPHAACGGFAVLPFLMEHFPAEVAVLVCTAITRHHGTHTNQLNQFELIEGTLAVLEQSLPDSLPRPSSIHSKSQLGDQRCFSEDYLLHMTESEHLWPLYANVIRILRLADQGSFQN